MTAGNPVAPTSAAAAEPGQWSAPRSIGAYVVASVGMVIANKHAAGLVHASTVLLAAQLLVTILSVVALAAAGVLKLEGSMRDAARWAPTGILSGILLWAGMQAVKLTSLSTLTVVRNANALFLLAAEWLFFGVRPSVGKVLSLLVILLGVCLYAWKQLKEAPSSAGGIAYVALDAVLVCADSMLERYFLAIRPLDLSTSALALIGNIVGLVPVLLLLMGPLSTEWAELRLPPTGIAWCLASMVGGVAMSFVGLLLRKAVSATGAVVVANVDKVLVLLYGVAVMGDRMDTERAIGCSLALAGGAWHAFARSYNDPIRDDNDPIRPSCSGGDAAATLQATRQHLAAFA